MDIEKEFEKFVEEIEEKLGGYAGSRHKKIERDKYNKKRKGQGLEDEFEKEASTYRDKARDDEKKKKRHFAFGGKKDKTRHGAGGYGKGSEEVEEGFKDLPPHLQKSLKDFEKKQKKLKSQFPDLKTKTFVYNPETGKPDIEIKEKIMDLEDTIKKIIGETNKNDKSDDGDGLDAVQPKAVKKKFKDRKDKDIDNDGDTDDSDKFLHKKRKAISKAISKEEVNEAYWKVSIPDMTPIFVETGSKSDIMKDMRKKLKPEALKGLAIERVSKAEMIKTYRNLVKGEGGEEEEPKKEEKIPSKLFGHIKTLMQKN